MPNSENIPDTRTSKRRPVDIAVIILNFALAVVNAIRFRHGHDSVDAVFAGLFLAVAVLYMFRSKHFGEHVGEPKISQLKIQDSKERKS